MDEADDYLVAIELKKKMLEIEDLKYRAKWYSKITAYIPIVSVILAVGGFLFGIYQFQKQQETQQNQARIAQQKEQITRELDQRIKIQDQIRTDLEQLLRFTIDKEQTLSRIAFLIEDMKAYLSIEEAGIQQETNSLVTNRRTITKSLVRSVVDDCDFSQSRDAGFVFLLLTDWDDYKEYIKEYQDAVRFILTKYSQALENVYKSDIKVISQAEFNNEKKTYYYRKGFGRLGLSKIIHFQDLVTGFREHFALISNIKDKEKSIEKFQQAINNPMLTKQLFGMSFNTDAK